MPTLGIQLVGSIAGFLASPARQSAGSQRSLAGRRLGHAVCSPARVGTFIFPIVHRLSGAGLARGGPFL